MKSLRKSLWTKLASWPVLLAFLINLTYTPYASAQGVPNALNLPVPGTMLPLSGQFSPALLKGITIHPENPLKFDFIIDTGDSKISDDKLKEESNKLIKYFLASLTVPEEELWVNLSPYEKDRIIPDGFSVTEMGRDLLAQDYILKQLTASLIYPENDLGKTFWDKVYKQAQDKFGTTDIPVNTFNKVWVVPSKAVVYEHNGSALVIDSHLKIMMEKDYLATNTVIANEVKQSDKEQLANDIMKEIVLPAIEKEVNTGENFAPLRQIYSSLILAIWYKQNLKESLLGQVYVDQNKTKGVDIDDKDTKLKIYNQYLEAFKKGVYNFVKEEYDPATQEVTPRKYFSGGTRIGQDAAKVFRKVDGDPSSLSAADRNLVAAAMVGKEGIYSVTALNLENTSATDAAELTKTREMGFLGWHNALTFIADTYKIKMTPNGKDPKHSHQEFVEGLLKLPIDRQMEALNAYRTLVNRNFDRVIPLSNGISYRFFKSILDQGLYQNDHMTSYPAQELVAVAYILEFHFDEFEQMVIDLQGEIPALDENLPSSELMKTIQDRVQALIKPFNIHPDVLFQVTQELTTFVYHELLKRESTTKRTVLINDTTIRDGQQSNASTDFTGEEQRAILQHILKYNALHRIETWGGAVVQSALLDVKRKGAPPEDPFYNLREQTRMLKQNLLDALGEDLDKISSDDQKLLFDRYEVKRDRRILNDAELNNILRRSSLSDERKTAVRRAYTLQQEMLLRGEYLVSLDPNADDVIDEFISVAYKNGVDIVRIFDAFDDQDILIKVIKSARKTNVRIQPTIMYSDNFPQGIKGFVKIAMNLLAAAGSTTDSLVIKDVDGLLDPQAAFEMIKSLRDAGVTVPIQLHTHDTNGNRQLTLLEAIRANGEQYPIVVDLAAGKLSGPFAQPNTRQFLNIITTSPWEGDLKNLDLQALKQTEDAVRQIVENRHPSPNPTTKERQNMVFARMPGGMITNFYVDFEKQLKGGEKTARQILLPAESSITFFDKNGRLSNEGQKLRDLLLPMVFQESRQVTTDLGEIPLGTPTSQWAGDQALANVLFWLLNGWLTLDTKNWTLKKNEQFPQNRIQQYHKAKGLTPGFRNFLVRRSKNPLLQELYPNVNKDLEALALSSSSKPPEKKSLEDYKKQREAIKKEYPEMTDSDEDLVLFALFSKVNNQFYHLLKERRHVRAFERLHRKRAALGESESNEYLQTLRRLEQMGAKLDDEAVKRINSADAGSLSRAQILKRLELLRDRNTQDRENLIPKLTIKPISDVYYTFLDILEDPKEDVFVIEEIAKQSGQIRALIESINYSRYVEALINLLELQDDDVPVAAAIALGDLQARSSATTLQNHIFFSQERNPYLRQQAVTALGKIFENTKDESITNDLIFVLENDPNSYTRQAAVEALQKIGHPEGFKVLINTLHDFNEFIVQAAAEALGNTGDQRAVDPILDRLEEITDDQHRLLEKMLRALGKLNDPEAIPHLIDELDHSNPYVVEAAMEALGRLKAEEAVPEIEKLIQTENIHFEKVGITALGAIGNTAAISILKRLSNDPNGFTRERAIRALIETNSPSVVPIIIARLKDSNQINRELAAYGLGLLRDPQSVLPLIDTLDDHNPYVVVSVIHSLSKLADPRAAESLQHLTNHLNSHISRAAKEALKKIPNADAAILPEIETTSPVGGIDLNPVRMNLQIKRDDNGVPLPMPQQPIGNMKIDGFTPVIINIQPINSIPLFLGINSDMKEGSFEVSVR